MDGTGRGGDPAPPHERVSPWPRFVIPWPRVGNLGTHSANLGPRLVIPGHPLMIAWPRLVNLGPRLAVLEPDLAILGPRLVILGPPGLIRAAPAHSGRSGSFWSFWVILAHFGLIGPFFKMNPPVLGPFLGHFWDRFRATFGTKTGPVP